MNMEKRALLAVLLSLVVWIGFNYFYGAPNPEPSTPETQQNLPVPEDRTTVSSAPLNEQELELFTSQSNQPASQQAPTSLKQPFDADEQQPEAATDGGAPGVGELAPELAETSQAVTEVVIETSLYRAVFSSQHAVLTSFQLKQHKERQPEADKDDAVPELVQSPENQYRELIPPEALNQGRFPCLLHFQDELLDSQLQRGGYSVDSPATVMLTEDQPTGTITFTKTLPKGLGIVKQFSFTDDSYLIGLDVRFLNASDSPLNAGSRIVIGGDINQEAAGQQARYGFVGPVMFIDGKVERINVKKVQEIKNYVGRLSWMAIADLYFFLSLIPDRPGVSQVELRPLAMNTEDSKAATPFEFSIWTGIKQLEPRSSSAVSLKLFCGPKEFERLEGVGFSLERIIDLGTFAILARPLLKGMNFFYRYVGNYGFSIIILTILVRLALAPLTHYQMKSMRKMQTLQPEINKIKNKYKKEPQLANQEMMALYKTHKVNPASGCLPIIIQIPVFFALYSVLAQAIELRGAPFILWITDLSTKDPYKITPILMGVSMYFQQKITPSTIDPKQRQIMNLMPIFMTFLFLNFPSGLVLYWLVSNLLSLSFQFGSKKYREITGTSDKSEKRR